MRELNNTKIIAVDHGYGNINTANTVTPTGITAYDTEPVFSGNVLEYNGRYYHIGEGHKKFVSDKWMDEDYYLLTMMGDRKGTPQGASDTGGCPPCRRAPPHMGAQAARGLPDLSDEKPQGYGVMSLAALFAGLTVKPQPKIDEWLKYLLMVHGVFFISCLIIPMLGVFKTDCPTWIGIAVLEFWCLYFCPISILSFLHFSNCKE